MLNPGVPWLLELYSAFENGAWSCSCDDVAFASEPAWFRIACVTVFDAVVARGDGYVIVESLQY